ncbi:MAG: SPASM domain-containing protein [Deltaproteobacteria bacterium]|nr:SPASM domain-containing protein [Deltaproteobacteria bacterium]
MPVDLLDAPLRISWDLCATEKQLSSAQLRSIAQQLTAAGVFYVSLENNPLTHPAIKPLLEQLLSGGCQVAIVLNGEPAELALLESIPRSVSLFVDCAAAVHAGQLDQARLRQTVARFRAAQRDPALLWLPRHGELPLLLDLLDICASEAVRGFKLPNQKISVNSEQTSSFLLPDCNDLEQLAVLIESSGLPEIPGLQLEVHDLFLWQLLQPLSGGKRSEYGGCQAADGLGHIDATGLLYPCSSWPEPLGQLLTDNLLDLWQTARRLEIRRQISQVPVGCEGCSDYPICLGGCRGLVKFCRDDGLKRDLLCSARRTV